MTPTSAEMRNIAPDSAGTRSSSTSPANPPPSRRQRKLDPVELSDWLEARLERISDRWLADVHGRYDVTTTGVNGLLREFLTGLVSFLPGLLGPHRDQVDPLWARAA